MKKTFLPGLLILVGFILLGIGGIQYFETRVKVEKSLEEAKELVVKETPSVKAEGRFETGEGETAGLLVIPRIDAELAIVEGTDPDDLEKGVGHFRGSYYPEEGGQIVLSGHRDTVFRNLGELELGDSLEIHMPYGKYQYRIIDTKIVSADDRSIITLQDEREELILTTCYPFSYIGDAPDRYILYAERVEI